MQIPFERSFASHEKAKYWSDKNTVKPIDISNMTKNKYIFDCDKCNHEIYISIQKIVLRNQWCSYCCNNKLCNSKECDICFKKSFASDDNIKYWSEKNIENPRNIFKGTNTKYWFFCNDCSHHFKISLSSITGTRKRWCHYCSVDKLCEDESCNICFNKSFASDNYAKYIVNNINPRLFTKGSATKCKINCPECNHIYESQICSIVKLKYKGCPYCGDVKLCTNDCSYCFNKSFASHEKSKYWSEKNTMQPRELFKGCDKKFLFNCIECNHEFNLALDKITSTNEIWCSYCGNHKLCENDNCIICFNKSFASHEKAKYWSEKNLNLKPRNIFKKSNTKRWFDCTECGNTFNITLSNIVQNNTWCNYCKNKTEKIMHKWLKERYPVVYQPKFEWCKHDKTNRLLPYDFEIYNRIIIEVDGRQHFEQVLNWESYEVIKDRDRYKNDCAIKNGKHVIRIYQEDIYNNKNNWNNKLLETINNLLTIEIPTIRYIGEIYTTHVLLN